MQNKSAWSDRMVCEGDTMSDLISDLLKELNIDSHANPHRPGDKKVSGDHIREWLKTAFFIERKSPKQIADERGCKSSSTVYRALRLLVASMTSEELEQFRFADIKSRLRTSEKKGKRLPRKLSEQTVISLRRRYRNDEITFAEMAIELDMPATTIQCAVTGRSWSSLNEIEPPVNIKKPSRNIIYNRNLIVKLIDEDKLTTKQVAEEIGLDVNGGPAAVKIICNIVRKTHLELRRTYSFVHADGIRRETLKQYEMARKHDLHPVNLSQMVRGNLKSLRGWTLEERANTPDFEYATVKQPPENRFVKGEQRGSWTVIRHNGCRERKSYFWCRCECGVEQEVRADLFAEGRSCYSCAARERMRQRFGDRTGQTHGCLTVISLASSGKHSFWTCRCNDCGVEDIIKRGDQLGLNTTHRRCPGFITTRG